MPARQALNAEYAHYLADKGFYTRHSLDQIKYTLSFLYFVDHMDWLLHIDIDELFYFPESTTLQSVFNELDRKGVMAMTFINHEGVPEGESSHCLRNQNNISYTDYFETTTLFRRHHFRYLL